MIDWSYVSSKNAKKQTNYLQLKYETLLPVCLISS